MTKKLLMGNEAFAHAALQAGVDVVAGYPGTPSSEVVETVAKLRAAGKAEGVYVEWSTNEKCALELLAGASYAGARTLFTCKQVGLNVASDALMSLNYVGVKGGMVLFVADDPGPISSQTEQDTRRFASFAKVPVLDPSTPEQGFQMIEAAYELSERFGTPVIVRPTTRLCHASAPFDVSDRTVARPLPPEGFVRDPKWVIFPKRSYEAHGEINERLRAMARLFSGDEAFSAFNPVEDVAGEEAEGATAGVTGDGARGDGTGNGPDVSSDNPASDNPATLGIAACGVSAAYAREALRMLRARAEAAGCPLPPYRFWQVGTPFPFPEPLAERFLSGLDRVLVLEELDHVVEDELLAQVGRTHAPVEVLGKLTGHARDRGENDVDDIARRLARFLGCEALLAEGFGEPGRVVDDARASAPRAGISADGAFADEPREGASVVDGEGATSAGTPVEPCAVAGSCTAAGTPVEAPNRFDPPVRPPVLCPGCPHRGSFYAVKRALGKREAVLCGDIGCYTLGNAQPLDAVDTCLCMGAGITMAQGFSVVEPGKKAVAFVGDSTFFASGLPGMVNAVYNGHDMTLVVLDNATTAMTGSQPHPGTGVTLMGQTHDPVQIRRVLEAIGVRCIVEADPLNLDEAVAAAKEALAFGGPSAVLYVSPCVQLVAPRTPFRVDGELCTGCKRCITSIGCPAIGFNRDLVGVRSGSRGQAFVDESLCNGCGLCESLCPTGALGPKRAEAADGEGAGDTPGGSGTERGDAAGSDERVAAGGEGADGASETREGGAR